MAQIEAFSSLMTIVGTKIQNNFKIMVFDQKTAEFPVFRSLPVLFQQISPLLFA